MKSELKKIVVSLVGKPGAGKGTFLSFLKEKLPPSVTIGIHRFSDPLGEALELLVIEKHRTNYQLLPQILNNPLNSSPNPSAWVGSPMALRDLENVAPIIQTLEKFGVPTSPSNIATFVLYLAEPTRRDNRRAWEDLTPEETESILANTVKRRALADPNQIVGLDGARWLIDEKMIRSFSDDVLSILVYLIADPNNRYHWTRARKIKAGEQDMTREQFDLADEAETEIYIPQIGERADWKIVNDGNKERLKWWAGVVYQHAIMPHLSRLGLKKLELGSDV